MQAIRQADWYDTPLYYDIIFDADSEKEAEFLEALNRQHGPAATQGRPLRLLEPACGSGRLLAALARRGHEVAGFDLNPHMLDYARQRLHGQNTAATLWQDHLESFQLPAQTPLFDLAHCLVSTFKYLLTEPNALAHLQRVASVLRPGGLYVLGFHLTDYASRKAQHERWVGERDGIRVICNTHTWAADPASRMERLRTRLHITRDGHSFCQETHWQFRTYDLIQVKELLRAAREFELITCHDFHYDASSPRTLEEDHYDLVLVLRKRQKNEP